MSMKTFLSLLLVIFTFLGILDASYITYEKLNGIIPPCSTYFKCGDVLNSSWASVGPIPLAFLGLLFYSLFFMMSLVYYFGKKEIRLFDWRIRLETFLALQGIFGAGFSLYLLFIMGVILKAWCLYCLLSAMICIILFVVSLTVYLLTKKEKYHEMHNL